MAQVKISEIIERAHAAKEETDQNRSLFEDVYEYMLPFKNTFNQPVGSTKTHNTPSRQYDSTAMVAANNFVNTMQTNFTPVFNRWAELRAGPAVPEEQRDNQNRQLQKLTDIIFTYLNASNFATESAEMYWDLGVGTGCLFVLEGDEMRPLNFVAAPSSQFHLEESKFGRVGGIYKYTPIKARLIKYRWKGAKINDKLAEIAKDKPNELVHMLEAVYFDEDEFVWRYEVIHEESEHRLWEKTYKEDVVLTPRWLKVPGFARGIGPFIMALADIKTLNKIKELMLKMAALNAFGVYTVERKGGINVNTATVAPGAFIPVERNGGPNGPTIQPLQRSGDFQVQQFMVEDLKDQLRQTMLDNRLPPENSSVRTAYEISERIKELQSDIGAAFGRLMYEYVQPLFRRVVSILKDRKLIQLPDGFDIDNFYVQVQVVSPIAAGQAAQDVQKFVQAFTLTQQINPELAMLSFEVEKFPSWVTEKLGSDAGMLREEDDKKALQQALMQGMQAQAQQTEGTQNAGTNQGQQPTFPAA